MNLYMGLTCFDLFHKNKSDQRILWRGGTMMFFPHDFDDGSETQNAPMSAMDRQECFDANGIDGINMYQTLGLKTLKEKLYA